MNRRQLILASAGSLFGVASSAQASPFSISPPSYIPPDAIPYYKPGPSLTRHMNEIDFHIRGAVTEINKSGWLWTVESCEGHGPRGWSDCPMLRLATTASNRDHLLALLYKSAHIGGDGGLGQTRVEIMRHMPVPRPWIELRVYARYGRHGDPPSQKDGIAYFERLAQFASS